jgi:2-phospho-L-lactate/phosphoenolpyruvate guanylyltransferase
MRTVAILPVKRFSAAKQRLDQTLNPGTRTRLAESMLTDVLIALRRSKRVESVIVVTAEPAAEALARGYEAAILAEGEEAGHSHAAMLGMAEAVRLEADRVLLVPGDCPALDPAEVDALLAPAPASARDVLVVPDRHGTGTNALVLTPPTVMEPAFGPGSRERHERLAADAGATCAVREVPSLMLDVDTGEDLDALRALLASHTGNASHTRGMLNQLARRLA